MVFRRAGSCGHTNVAEGHARLNGVCSISPADFSVALASRGGKK